MHNWLTQNSQSTELLATLRPLWFYQRNAVAGNWKWLAKFVRTNLKKLHFIDSQGWFRTTGLEGKQFCLSLLLLIK
jgi:hypothetical protein